MSDADDMLLGGLAALVALTITAGAIWFGLYTLTDFSTEAACLKNGYRIHAVAWNLSQYCINRTNQTDETVPLDYARAHPRRAQ